MKRFVAQGLVPGADVAIYVGDDQGDPVQQQNDGASVLDLLPERVQIGPVIFYVDSDPDNQPTARTVQDDGSEVEMGVLGMVNIDTGVLWVKSDRRFTHLRQTFMHELTHLVAIHAGVNLDETEVESFANVLTDVLDRNPDIPRLFAFEEDHRGQAVYKPLGYTYEFKSQKTNKG